jgi:glycerol kinase
VTTHILAIDQGTTSTRSIIYGPDLKAVATAQQEFPQIFPAPGWVEHDAEDLWRTTLDTARQALAQSGLTVGDLAGIGIANQRETTLVWDRKTGKAIHNAIVWQDRRTAETCDALTAAGHGDLVAERTGLRIDPYFSATKIGWILDAVPGARARAEAGELAFGTVDSFLLWRMTGGTVHAIDATNASRTLLCDIRTAAWDEDMLRLFQVPQSLLPEIKDSAGLFGETLPEILGAPVGIRGIAGDQQAALIGQACFEPGSVKATYGTGGFILLNTGSEPVRSTHQMLTTIAYQFGGKRHYALEGSIFSAGAGVQWLRDGLGLVESVKETGALAAAADPQQPVYLVPAFTGLGAPYWNSHARAVITGITRGTTKKELARAVLEGIAYQTGDLLQAMLADSGREHDRLVFRVDGGMASSDWAMQFLSDLLEVEVDRPTSLETTALGAAYLAGFDAGIYPAPTDFAAGWTMERSFKPAMPAEERERRYAGWRTALAQALHAPN